MYMNFWYPIARSDEVTTDKPLRTQILSMMYVAFRDENDTPYVLSDTCVHRGGSLGKGRIKNGCVVCPYHGWEYGGDGHCVNIPSLGTDGKLPSRAKVDSYPVQERYGILFAFLGDLPEEERPPLWDVTEFDQPDWRANKLVVFEVDYYYERSVENGLDPAHNEFVHPNQGAPGMNEELRGKPIEVVDIPWGSQFKIKFGREKEHTGLMEQKEAMGDQGGVTAGSGHLGPNTLVTWIQFTDENMFHQYFFEAPINDKRTRIFFLNMRHFLLEPEKDDWIIDVNMQIAKEDIDVLVELNPIRTPDTTTKEILLPADRPIVRYRELMKEWDARGWRLDWNEMQRQRGNVAYAIPCPDRRTSKNWVLDPVPTLPATKA